MPPSKARPQPTTSPTASLPPASRSPASPTACQWAANSTTSTKAPSARPSAPAPICRLFHPAVRVEPVAIFPFFRQRIVVQRLLIVADRLLILFLELFELIGIGRQRLAMVERIVVRRYVVEHQIG